MNGGVSELELLREQVQTHQAKLEEHSEAIKLLKEGQEKVLTEQEIANRRIDVMERNQLELKNVIYSENKETRDTMRGITEKLLEHINMLTGNKQISTTLEHDYQKLLLETRDKKNARFWEWFGKAAGAGGIIAALVTFFMQFLQ